jgi:hypothetical protein
MTLKYVVGFSYDAIVAKDRALFFYNEVEGRKSVIAIESQIGKNELDEPAWFTTIWYNLHEAETEKEAQKEYFIGSTDISPNDPNWYDKWKALQDAANEQTQLYQETTNADWFLNTDEFPIVETMDHIADK